MAERESDTAAKIVLRQFEEMLNGREISPDVYELLSQIVELSKPITQLSTAAAIANTFQMRERFMILRALMNAAYVEACRVVGRDPADPGADAEIGSSKGKSSSNGDSDR
jgi:hypothetical protein